MLLESKNLEIIDQVESMREKIASLENQVKDGELDRRSKSELEDKLGLMEGKNEEAMQELNRKKNEIQKENDFLIEEQNTLELRCSDLKERIKK